MAEGDRISQLRKVILDKILVLLPIQEAARTAVLSTNWRHIWPNLTHLNFDKYFFDHVENKYSGRYQYASASFYVISKVLLNHNGPILKVVFGFQDIEIQFAMPRRTFDIDQWLLFVTQKGVEEIYLGFKRHSYKLPDCIFSCQTLKRLHLYAVSVDFRNAPCILPNATSLCFEHVDFDPRNLQGYAAYVPMLECLSFNNCRNMFHLNITAPKLGSLKIISCNQLVTGFHLDLSSLCTLDLDSSSVKVFVKEYKGWGQLLALNVEYLKLSKSFGCKSGDGWISALNYLLLICPKLYKLDMCLKVEAEGIMSVFLKKHRNLAQTHQTLHALKLSSFKKSWSKMRFIKKIPDFFPALEKIVIHHKKFDSEKEAQIMQEVLHSLPVSIKVKIVYF